MSKSKNTFTIATRGVPRWLLWVNIILTLFYFSWWFSEDYSGNVILFGLLFICEIYHVLMVLMFWFTVRNLHKDELPKLSALSKKRQPSIDVFLTVAGEPIEIVRQTVKSLKKTAYENKTIYILNDSFVAGKENWQDYERLAKKMGIKCFTRTVPGGAKAGNINNALRQTSGELIAIFDADMCPLPQFFAQTVPYFHDKKVGFVQTPQFYENSATNVISAAAWEQQEFFFGPIMRGKQSSNAAFICGTNVVIRREAIEAAGGMNEKSIAEDFLTSLYIHKLGWTSVYVPDVLAKGLAPEDLLSYYKQQLRWARGSVEILFRHNPLLMKNLSWAQKVEYLSSALFYCNGVAVMIDGVVPLMFLFFGLTPIITSTSTFAFYFLPFIMSVIYSLHVISGRSLTFRAISFTQASWYLQLQAIISSLTGQKTGFVVTPKQAQTGNFLFLAYPHIAYGCLAIIGGAIAIQREGLTPSVIANLSWVTFNVLLFMPYISSAIPWQSIIRKITWERSSSIEAV